MKYNIIVPFWLLESAKDGREKIRTTLGLESWIEDEEHNIINF